MPRSPRHLLLPMWIQVFSWIFLVLGVAAAAFVILGAAFDGNGNFTLNGLRYSGPMRAPMPLAMGVVFAYYGYAAYALLWGRKEGRVAGLGAGYLGLATCWAVAMLSLADSRMYIPLEPFLQIPFIIKLHRLKRKWEAPAETPLASPPPLAPVATPADPLPAEGLPPPPPPA